MAAKGKTMKAVKGIGFVGVLCVMVLVGYGAWVSLSIPIIQMSATTQGPVACASGDTNWEFKSMDDPACVEVAKAGRAEVEWVK